MTDTLEGSGQESSTQAPVQEGNSGNQPSSSPSERVFRQPEVDGIVQRAKHEAVERYRRLSAEQPEYARKKYGDNQEGEHQQPSREHSQNLSHDEVRRMAAEEVQRSWNEQREREQRNVHEQEAQRIATDFFGKLSAGKEKYPDFDSVVGNIRFGSFPNVVRLATTMVDNTPDIMYELGKDRGKMALLENLAMLSPDDAVVQFRKFADSVRENAESTKVQHPREPLSHIRPSGSGVDSGEMSVRDYRSKYRV